MPSRSRWLATGLALICLVGEARALDPNHTFSQYLREQWTTDNNFPGGAIDAVTQTADGYLWMGTEKGLVRFDGVNFRLTSSFSEFFRRSRFRFDHRWRGPALRNLLGCGCAVLSRWKICEPGVYSSKNDARSRKQLARRRRGLAAHRSNRWNPPGSRRKRPSASFPRRPSTVSGPSHGGDARQQNLARDRSGSLLFRRWADYTRYRYFGQENQLFVI